MMGKLHKLSKYPTVDYVLVWHLHDIKYAVHRALFEDVMRSDGLLFEKELIGRTVFLKVYTPFKRLLKEAERIKLEMPLKRCEIVPPEPTGLIQKFIHRFESSFITDDEVDYVSAPFQIRKIHLYEGSEFEETFFRSSQRQLLTHHILINLDIWEKMKRDDDDGDDSLVQKWGLLYLLMKKAYSDAFVLHDQSAEDPIYTEMKQENLDQYHLEVPNLNTDARKDLNETWTAFTKYQPLWKVRNYFGEKVAFYFAWQGCLLTYLWIPAVLGIIIFCYGLISSIKHSEEEWSLCLNETERALLDVTMFMLNYPGKEIPPLCRSFGHLKQVIWQTLAIINGASDNIYCSIFSLIICVWGVLFMETWRRQQNTLAYMWDVDTYDAAEPDRPEFFGTKAKPDPITAELQMIYPFSRRILKFLVSFWVLSLMMCLVFASVCSVLVYKVVVRHKLVCPGIEVNGVKITSDDPRAGSPMVCLLTITVVPALMNGFSILLLSRVYQYIARALTDWENHRTQSDYDSSLILKLFAFQFVNSYTSLIYMAFFRHEEHGFQEYGVFGMGSEYKDTCERGHCMPLLSFQVLVLMMMKPIPKFTRDVVIPWLRNLIRRHWKRHHRSSEVDEEKAIGTQDDIDIVDYPIEFCYIYREYHKPSLGDFTLSEYTEKVISFGYLVLFSAAIPLAPAIACLINMVDNVIDARRLLWLNRRPVAFISSDIGMWLYIVRFIVFCGVVTNAFIVGYTSSFVTRVFSPGHIAATVAMGVTYNMPTTVQNLLAKLMDSTSGAATAVHRLFVVVLFEHIVAAISFILHVITPDKTSAVKLAERKEKYQVTKILEEGKIPRYDNDADDDNEELESEETSMLHRQRLSEHDSPQLPYESESIC